MAFFSSPLRAASRARAVVRSSSCFELDDQVLQVLGLPRQLRRALALGGSVFSTSACCFCRCSVRAVSCACRRPGWRGSFRGRRARPRSPCAPSRAPKGRGERLDVLAHVRQHGAEQDRRAHRLQRVLRRHQHRRRRIAADALQRRQHIADDMAPALERGAQRRLLLVQRRQPLFGGRDLLFDGAHARGDVDQLPVELAAVVADLLDLAAQTGLGLARLLLLAADGLQFLVALLQRVELGRAFGGGRSCGGAGVSLAAVPVVPGYWSAGRRRSEIDERHLAGRARRRLGGGRQIHGGSRHERCRYHRTGGQAKPLHQKGNHQRRVCKNGTAPAINHHDWYGIKTKPAATGKRGQHRAPRIPEAGRVNWTRSRSEPKRKTHRVARPVKNRIIHSSDGRLLVSYSFHCGI